MFKKSNVPEVSWGNAYVVTTNTPDRLVGKIFAVIETMGLKETQETSAKDIIRTVIWEVFNNAIHISPERHNEIREAFEEHKKSEDFGREVPPYDGI